MDEVRTNKLKWRWSLVTAGIITLFWTIWYLINGEVPEVNQITLLVSETFNNNQPLVWILSSSISRWWDIFLGPVWIVVLIEIFTSKKNQSNDVLSVSLIVALGGGLLFGFVLGIFTVLGGGLYISLFVALVLSVFGLGIDLLVGLVVVLAVGLGMSISLGLGLGMIISLWLGMIIVLINGLILGLKCIKIKPIFSYVLDWLMARN